MEALYVSLQQLENALSSNGFLPNELVEKALAQAQRSLGNKKRDEGTPYLENHVYPVTMSIIECPELKGKITPEILAGALLHDVLEDDVSLDREEFKARFGERVYRIVDSLTKRKRDNIGRKTIDAEYFERLGNAPEEAKYIKLADRLHNLSTLRFSNEAGKLSRYVRETETFYIPFARQVSEYYCNKIEDKLKELKASSRRFP